MIRMRSLRLNREDGAEASKSKAKRIADELDKDKQNIITTTVLH